MRAGGWRRWLDAAYEAQRGGGRWPALPGLAAEGSSGATSRETWCGLGAVELAAAVRRFVVLRVLDINPDGLLWPMAHSQWIQAVLGMQRLCRTRVEAFGRPLPGPDVPKRPAPCFGRVAKAAGAASGADGSAASVEK